MTDIRLPDIGDFTDVPVIEVLIKPGDDVLLDQPILTLESDKATLEVPSPQAGRIETVAVAVGDRVSMGSLIGTILPAPGAAPETVPQAAAELQRSRVTKEAPVSQAMLVVKDAAEVDFDVAVIGGGPGGYSAAFRAADLGLRVVLIEKDETLGGVCLNVGCIPSKALLHVAALKLEMEGLAEHGLAFSEPAIGLGRLRSFKNATVSRLTTGLAQMASKRSVEVVRGTATFASSRSLTVDGTGLISFAHCIIAAGSSPVRLPFLPEDPRIIDSTGALELPLIPKRMLVIGGGIIGLEMATVYSALGATVDVVERLDGLLAGIDRDAVAIWRKENAKRLGDIFLGASVEKATAGPEGITVSIGSSPPVDRTYDLVLQSAGRRPNGASLGLEAAGIAVDSSGFITVDNQMRTRAKNIFAIGDIAGDPMLAHKAAHEGHVAAEVAAGMKSHFDAKVIPSVAYTNPEIAWVGVTEDAAKISGRKVKTAKFPWAASGRAIANGAAYGMTKLIFDPDTHRLVGGVIVGPNAGDMIGEICLGIEMGADAVDIGKTIHPHPTLGETIGMAAELFEGVCTDLPPSGHSSGRVGAS
ncbi:MULTISPECIES: dihydrolipoyl dehydrogenase [Rhizobium]|uniref:Dihydrolipoyl dehydrogenase n=1 Tax=Rhizobium paranaense TaxID=1650438 RepID=A0A7W9D4V3_9HYPH|nr:dihydrolipoyl dehydrogenase [Rhizobium paranaense]MBB5577326.1 dihydrolipoamide dehydrogenase [Rhizobium paranaense]